MQTNYDPDSDAFYARFVGDAASVAETRAVAPGVTIDVDAAGNLNGIEVLSIQRRENGTYGTGAT
jgi:uncharacterized protein YuzE